MPLERLLIIFIGISSCTTSQRIPIAVEPCILDNQYKGGQCPDRFLEFEKLENWACFSPQDTEMLLRK